MIKIEINSQMEKEEKNEMIVFDNHKLLKNDETLSDKTILFYGNSKIDISKLDKSNLVKYLPKVLSKNIIEKHFTDSDILKLKDFLPMNVSKDKVRLILTKTPQLIKKYIVEGLKDSNGVKMFQELLRNDYFSYVNKITHIELPKVFRELQNSVISRLH